MHNLFADKNMYFYVHDEQQMVKSYAAISFSNKTLIFTKCFRSNKDFKASFPDVSNSTGNRGKSITEQRKKAKHIAVIAAMWPQ